MTPSQVYSMNTNGRSMSSATGLVAQMTTLFDAAGFAAMIHPGDAVAIKVHCGEWNNTAYLRPVYARALADRIRALGGRPFVCDTTTLTYARVASRATGLDLLDDRGAQRIHLRHAGLPFHRGRWLQRHR